MTIQLIGIWSHALAALLFACLAASQLRLFRIDERNRHLFAAYTVTAAWALGIALLGRGQLFAGLAESARNFAFLAFMFGIIRSSEADERDQGLKAVYCTVAGVIGLQIVIAGVLPRFAAQPIIHHALTATGYVIGLTIAAGSLVLVHNLYGRASPSSRWGIRLPAIALAGMWGYDLHLYTSSYLSGRAAEDLFAMRGAVMAMLVPLFALAAKRNAEWKMQVSRSATFQSVSLIAILGYLIAMMSASEALEAIGGHWARIGQIALVSAMTIAAAILIPSSRARAWLRVMLAKHLFEHRYDYRKEWLEFTRAIGRSGGDAAPLGQRIVKALADIAGSPGGLLLVVEEGYRLSEGARWNWPHTVGQGGIGEYDFLRFLERTGHIVAFDALEHGSLRSGASRIMVPEWISSGGAAWAGIPLLHNERLTGIVILEQPIVRRPLDWEDFDLFRTAGIQAASYLAEARSQEALADAQRFDEFNRRFAFIMHDIKNLVSQLSLVARNAERHADNPEFRADMIATLQSSVKKMNDLLARLSQDRRREAEPARPTPLKPLLSAIAASKQRLHPVDLTADAALSVLADPLRIEQALLHLVQNAVEASPPGEPVRIRARARGPEIAIEVIDSGSGMSPDFVRSRLFQPFASTKEGGFGIGAFEARSLITAMGGRVYVDSRPGEGSRFTILLPAASSEAATQLERMSA